MSEVWLARTGILLSNAEHTRLQVIAERIGVTFPQLRQVQARGSGESA
jgi:hypothetical protein